MEFLDKIWTLLKSEFAYVFTNVSTTINALLSEIPDDEIAIFHSAQNIFADALKAGKGWGEAAADTWTYVENQESAAFGKVSNLLLEAFMAKFETGSPKTD
jgi:hypothetical protein